MTIQKWIYTLSLDALLFYLMFLMWEGSVVASWLVQSLLALFALFIMVTIWAANIEVGDNPVQMALRATLTKTFKEYHSSKLFDVYDTTTDAIYFVGFAYLGAATALLATVVNIAAKRYILARIPKDEVQL